MEEAESEYNGPELSNLLLSFLDVNHQEHFENLQESEEPELNDFLRATRALSKYAFDMLGSGALPDELAAELEAYLPQSSPSEKTVDLLQRTISHDYLEFEVAYDVVWRLQGVRKRIVQAVMVYDILRKAKASHTAEKYLRRVVSLFLAGYVAEMVFMCGATVELALEHRFPDELLTASGIAPKWKGNKKVFSVSDRLKYAKKHFHFTNAQHKLFWQIINWRNDVAHVQPDITDEPTWSVLVITAVALSIIVPREEGWAG